MHGSEYLVVLSPYRLCNAMITTVLTIVDPKAHFYSSQSSFLQLESLYWV